MNCADCAVTASIDGWSQYEGTILRRQSRKCGSRSIAGVSLDIVRSKRCKEVLEEIARWMTSYVQAES